MSIWRSARSSGLFEDNPDPSGVANEGCGNGPFMQVLRLLGIDDLQALGGSHRKERHVRADEQVKGTTATEVNGHRELKGVQGTQSLHWAVLSNQALSLLKVQSGHPHGSKDAVGQFGEESLSQRVKIGKGDAAR